MMFYVRFIKHQGQKVTIFIESCDNSYVHPPLTNYNAFISKQIQGYISLLFLKLKKEEDKLEHNIIFSFKLCSFY